mgnify:CR=1 FL=1
MGKVKAAKKAIWEGHKKSQKIYKDLLKEKQSRAAELARKRAARKRAEVREIAKGPKPFKLSEEAKKEITRRGGRVTRRMSKVDLGAGAPKTKAMRKQEARRKDLYGW